MSYHIAEIPQGVYGEVSKITEEGAELIDAHNQGNKILVLCELADLVGAIEGYLENTTPQITILDLLEMAHANKRAFVSGTRQKKN